MPRKQGCEKTTETHGAGVVVGSGVDGGGVVGDGVLMSTHSVDPCGLSHPSLQLWHIPLPHSAWYDPAEHGSQSSEALSEVK